MSRKLGNLGFVAVLALAAFAVSRLQFNWPVEDDFVQLEWYRAFYIDGALRFIDLLSLHSGPHYVLPQALAVTGLWGLFGITFAPLVWANFVFLALSAALLACLVLPHMNRPLTRVTMPAALLLVFFYPLQGHDILWPMMMHFYFGMLLMSASIFVVEKWRELAAFAAAMIAALATFTILHGVFLWLSITLHYLMRVSGRRRLIAIPFALAFLISLALVFPRGGIGGWSLFAELAGLTHFYVAMLGTVSAERHVPMLFATGLGVILLLALTVYPFRRFAADGGADRVGLVLIVIGLMWVGAVTLGRYQFGFGSVILTQFHGIAIAMIPLLAGVLVLSVRSFDYGAGWGVLRLSPALLVLCAVILAVPAGLQLAQETRTKRAFAMLTTCDGRPDTGERLADVNWFFPFEQRVTQNLALIAHLCTDRLPRDVAKLGEMPSLFVELMERRPELAPAVRAIWNVYTIRADLQRAFPVLAPTTPQALLDFFRHDAKTGSRYDMRMLGAHRDALTRL